MKKIQELIDWIDDELDGAKCYAEKYIYYKAKGNQWYSKFHTMAEDELKHADLIHQLAVEEIDEISNVFKAPAEMQKAWDESHVKYVDKAAWIKQMLSMQQYIVSLKYTRE